MLQSLKSLLFILVLGFTSVTTASGEEVWDPLEPMNRGVFWFNDKFDIYILEPVSSGYDYVMPGVAKTGVSNFFSNLKFPIYFVSDILQLKFGQAAHHSGRFLINSTIGLAGLIDVAKDMGLEHHYEDVGVALGYYGVPSGPYIVLPFLGPSNLRDTVGTAANIALNPTFYPYYFSNTTDAQKYFFSTGANALDVIQTRASIGDSIKSAKETSLDYYLFVQSAYYQRRRALITDGELEDEEEFIDYDDNDDTQID